MLSEQAEICSPPTEEEKTAILAQLDRLLRNSHFHKSKRFPVFLRFVVTEALAGRSDQLKERTLGIEVFGKDANYDTTDDPIVRVTAGEIRKRIAQYYQEPGHDHEIKLLLPAGSYVPQFCFPDAASHTVASEITNSSITEEAPHPPLTSAQKVFPWKQSIFAVCMILVAVSLTILWQTLHVPAIQEFWGPFVKSADPVLFCIADQSQYSTITLRDAADPLHQTTLND